MQRVILSPRRSLWSRCPSTLWRSGSCADLLGETQGICVTCVGGSQQSILLLQLLASCELQHFAACDQVINFSSTFGSSLVSSFSHGQSQVEYTNLHGGVEPSLVDQPVCSQHGLHAGRCFALHFIRVNPTLLKSRTSSVLVLTLFEEWAVSCMNFARKSLPDTVAVYSGSQLGHNYRHCEGHRSWSQQAVLGRAKWVSHSKRPY